MALCSDSNWRSVAAVPPRSACSCQFLSWRVGALAPIQGGQVVSKGSCKREPPACEHSDWLGLPVWPVVAHVQECCRVVVWMLEQVISATFWTALALDPGLRLIGDSEECDVGLLLGESTSCGGKSLLASSSASSISVALTKHFTAIGAHACDSCRLLKSVDLCNTNVEEIPEFTFVHCTSLREVLLPTTLHTIRVKAFMNCAALVELAIPPSLRYIRSRAFLGL